MRALLGLIANITITDAIDILAVAALFYFVFSLLRGTRSQIALRGMITLLLASFFIYFIARIFDLSAVAMIFGQLWFVILLVFIIVFHNELKMALTNLGQLRVFRALFTQSGHQIGEIVKAVRTMSTRHVGALIAIEQRNALKPYADTGTPVDSVVISEVIRTIFTPYSPLHDGSAVIIGDRLVSAGCILPLTGRQDLSKELGTRHRAAIGLSEETDALIIVVSEETGTVSLAHNGVLERPLTPEQLRKRLEAEMKVGDKTEQEDEDEVSA